MGAWRVVSGTCPTGEVCGLDATWTPGDDAGPLTTTVSIHHHAGGPTFTPCVAPASAGAFHADAALVDPLARVTGLEFQRLDQVNGAAA